MPNQASFLCPQCRQMRLFQQQGTNHILHLLATVFLCGLWLPIWIIIALSNQSNAFRCSQCGYGDNYKHLANPYLRQQTAIREQRIKDLRVNDQSVNPLFYKIGSIVLAVFLVGASIFYYRHLTTNTKPASLNSQTAPTLKPEPQTPPELLSTGKQLLSQPNPDIVDKNKAIRFLKSIPKTAKEYKEAQQLLKPEEKRIQRESQVLEAEAKISRMNMASKLQDILLSNGLDAYVTIEGKNADILRVKYILVSRPMVYKIIKETDFISTIRNAGFKKVIFTDGYDETYSLDL